MAIAAIGGGLRDFVGEGRVIDLDPCGGRFVGWGGGGVGDAGFAGSGFGTGDRGVFDESYGAAAIAVFGRNHDHPG